MSISLCPSYCYDAAPILGLGEASNEPLPDPAPDEIVVRVGAWSLQDLRTCEAVVRYNLMWKQSWYDVYPLSRKRLIPGVYCVRLPIPDSNNKNFTDQLKLLRNGEEVASAALVAVVLLCHLKETGQDLLKRDWVRCAEAVPNESHIVFNILSNRVRGRGRWDAHRRSIVWLAGSQKL